jgi:iron(III) transport system ATP-binding protein
VTHDPEEALAICDRVAVLREGVLHQCASPRQLVAEPATAFVGSFLLQGNLLPAERRGDRFCTPLGWLAPARHPAPGAGPEGDSASPLQVLVSPLAIDLLPETDGPACITGREFLGREWLYQVRFGELSLRVRLPLAAEFTRGARARPVLRSSSPARLYPAGVDLQVLSASTCPSPPLPAGDSR